MGGTSFSWDQRQNRKGIFQFFLSKSYFYCNEWKCNIAQIASIAAFIANSSEYDLVLLQDLWMRPDHEMIRAALPKVIHNKMSSSSGKIVFCINLQNRVMTRVGDLAPALCDGRVLPTSCSGLALVSRCLKGLTTLGAFTLPICYDPGWDFERKNWSRKHLQVPYPWDWVQGFLRARFGFK